MTAVRHWAFSLTGLWLALASAWALNRLWGLLALPAATPDAYLAGLQAAAAVLFVVPHVVRSRRRGIGMPAAGNLLLGLWLAAEAARTLLQQRTPYAVPPMTYLALFAGAVLCCTPGQPRSWGRMALGAWLVGSGLAALLAPEGPPVLLAGALALLGLAAGLLLAIWPRPHQP